MSEKLQKVLARAGLGSRREIETWIEDGRLMVNGAPALLGTRVEPKDEVKLDGRRLRLVPESLVNRKILMYHKPEGEVTTRKDPEGRPTVFDRLPPMRGSRWVAIGRLDLNTSGLLLFTNDGEVANRLMHPSHEVEREYAVRILGELKPAQRKKLLEGVLLEDGLAKFNSIESRGGGGSNRWYHVTLSEGRTREVRRMFESMDLVVSRLIRVRYGPVSLDPLLKQGMNRELNLDETNRLCEAVGIEPQAPRAERRREYQQSRRSETTTGYSEFAESDDAERSTAPGRKPKVIGSKADELPTDRVERAAELLRRRRAAESAGVEFSGRNGRLSGKRTLRESELRKIAQEKAAEKAGEKTKRGERDGGAEFAAAPSRSRTSTGRTATSRTTAGRTSSRAAVADTDAPRARSSARAATGTRSATGTRATTGTRSATGTRSSSRSGEAGASTGRSTASRSPTTRTSATRSSASRTGPARASTRVDDDFAPRRSARPATRSRDADEEAPRRRSAAKPAARSAAARDERPARSRAAAGTAERTSRGTGSRAKPAAAGRSATGRATGERATAARSSSSRSASSRPTGERSNGASKSAGRSSGTGKPARSSARPAAPARAGGASRGAGKSASAKPAGKGKRTR